MILQENIKKKAEGFGKLAPMFLEAADYALSNQWISVDEDLPCNHEELIILDGDDEITEKVLLSTSIGIFCGFMEKKKTTVKNKSVWVWSRNPHIFDYYIINYWMPLPELPKE